jgi:hypothetical protein
MPPSLQRKIERARQFRNDVSDITRNFRARAFRATNRAKRCVRGFFPAPAQATFPPADFHRPDKGSEEILSELDGLIKKIKDAKRPIYEDSEISSSQSRSDAETDLQGEVTLNPQPAIKLLDDILSFTDIPIDSEKERQHLDKLRQEICMFSKEFNNAAYGEKCDRHAFAKDLRALISELGDQVTRNRAEAIVSRLGKSFLNSSETKAILMDLYKLGGVPDKRMNEATFFHAITNPRAEPIQLAAIEYEYCLEDFQFKQRMEMAGNSISSKADKKQFSKLTRDYLEAPTTAARKSIAGNLKAFLANSEVTELSSSAEITGGT